MTTCPTAPIFLAELRLRPVGLWLGSVGQQVAELDELPPLVVMGPGVGQLVHPHQAGLLPGVHHQHPLHTCGDIFG